MRSKNYLLFILIGLLVMNCHKSNSSTPGGNEPPDPPGTVLKNKIDWWLTKADQSALLQKRTALTFSASGNSLASIAIDSAVTYQGIDGFGYTLTGGSAFVINTLDAATKNNLLQELFGNEESSISINYLRISIGASDLNAEVFSYDDMPAGETDEGLEHFSLDKDRKDVIPLLKEILSINPSIKILATPWSPPAWMKDNASSIGGSLRLEYYDVYAQYFVKYIQAMRAEGIIIDAITPQNEPLHPGNNPSMLMTAENQAAFIKNDLGPAFEAESINTKIIIYDHNCDKPDYPISILSDGDAAKYIDGSAFHLYAGDISALSTLHSAFPSKNVYFTEQYTSSKGAFGGDLLWHIKNVIIGSMNNWSRVALEWNLANDENFEPHAPGGCTECKGALTINGSITRNVAYYNIAHASKFVRAGSVRISATSISGLYVSGFLTPQGKKVLIVLNEGSSEANFNIKYKNNYAQASLPGGSVATYVW